MVALTSTGPLIEIDRSRVLHSLIDSATDPDVEVRLAAFRGLGAVGPTVLANPPVVLVAAIEDSSDPIRSAAAYAIVNYRHGLGRRIPALVRSMELSDPQARDKYVEILSAIRPPKFSAEIIPGLITALDRSDIEVCSKAAKALESYKQDA